MSNHLHFFQSAYGSRVVALPFELERIVDAWCGLRVPMYRTLPEPFTRNEWAHLMAILSEESLHMPFHSAFGLPAAGPGRAGRLVRPRGTIAVWLPNNVSLLGPLSLILLSLTGNRLLLKGGSRGADLTSVFLQFALDNLAPGQLRDYLAAQVEYAVFGRGDAIQERFLTAADIRIVFGTDDAANAICQDAPNPRAKAFYFTDRQSQAWIEPAAATDDVLADLIRAFNVNGQAGCTSPRRVVLLGGDMSGALALRDRMVRLWPATIRTSPPPMRTCSDNTLALQWARATGWDAIAVPQGRAVVAVAPIGVPTLDSPMFLAVSPATVDEALAALPANVQTVGHALHSNSEWLNLVARTTIKRWVPISRMHHFGPVWDGDEFWHECFEYVEIDT